MSIETLRKVWEAAEIDYSVLFDFNDSMWCISDRDVRWWDNGGVYSGYAIEGTYEKDGYVFINLDCDTGITYTEVFKQSQQVTPERFEELYDE